jgi:predicted Zn-dependent peptidase
MLYGATVSSVVSKQGESQMMTISISSLDDKFSLENNKISSESFELLMSLLFDPRLDDNGNFFAEDIEREKRLLIQRLDSEDNEKRIYALRQLEKNMFKGEPYAINRYGTAEQIKTVTNDELLTALSYLKENSKIQITVVGTADVDEIKSIAVKYFSTVNRNYIAPTCATLVAKAEKVNTIVERIDVKQGKLVLGFRVNKPIKPSGDPQMRAFNDVFGGGPYSKLFANVREKLSLCYYCSARFDRRKNCLIVQCGCEEENMDKAVDEILNQLEEIKKGNFDDEFTSSKMGLADNINSVNDDSLSLATWYATQITDDEIVSTADSVKDNNDVTKQQIQECASLLSLDTIYKLVGTKEGE